MPFKTLREFIQLESSGGVLLFAMAILALILDNSPLSQYYHALFNLPLSLQLGTLKLAKPLLLWINDGFMSIFFLLVGLEIKREMLEGELNSIAKATLPAIAAIGGMIAPALIYTYFNSGDPVSMRGWAIPTATDIAFSLGILSLLRSCIPVSLKIFLTALAIFDDIGAILIIALFYSHNISVVLLIISLGLIAVLFLLNRFNVTTFAPYFIVGAILWVCVLKSGVHATMAGILLAFFIPLRDKKNPESSPLRKLEHMLHPWVAFLILPLFAFANAGVSFKGMGIHTFIAPVTLGITLALFLGKQLGIWGSTMLAIKTGVVRMPRAATGMGIYGVALIAGVGFTMSLFIGSLAFGRIGGTYPAMVRMGVIMGSFMSGLLGYIVLKLGCRPQHELSEQEIE